jgi:hypothetical protein
MAVDGFAAAPSTFVSRLSARPFAHTVRRTHRLVKKDLILREPVAMSGVIYPHRSFFERINHKNRSIQDR